MKIYICNFDAIAFGSRDREIQAKNASCAMGKAETFARKMGWDFKGIVGIKEV